MSEVIEFTFRNVEDEFDDEDWNISEDILSEGNKSPEQVRNLQVEGNMQHNSFFKYDKAYCLRNIKKFKSHGDEKEQEIKLRKLVPNQIKVECLDSNDQLLWNKLESEVEEKRRKQSIHSENLEKARERKSLKNEVSMLLRALINCKKNRKNSEPSELLSSDLQSSIKVENKMWSDELVTMRQVDPLESSKII